MSDSKYESKDTYIVCLVSNVEIDNLPDLRWTEIIGSYNTKEDSKRAVAANALLIADNDNQCLTIYKVNLEENKVYDFYRKDLKAEIDAAKQSAVIEEIKFLNEREEQKGEIFHIKDEPHIFKGPLNR